MTTLVEPGVGSPVSMGVEMELARGLVLRTGASVDPGIFAVGLGVTVPAGATGTRSARVDVAWQWHPELGGSSFASLSLVR